MLLIIKYYPCALYAGYNKTCLMLVLKKSLNIFEDKKLVIHLKTHLCFTALSHTCYIWNLCWIQNESNISPNERTASGQGPRPSCSSHLHMSLIKREKKKAGLSRPEEPSSFKSHQAQPINPLTARYQSLMHFIVHYTTIQCRLIPQSKLAC